MICLIGILLMITNRPEKVDMTWVPTHFSWWLDPDDGWVHADHYGKCNFKKLQDLGRCSTGAHYYKCVNADGEIHFFKNNE